MTQRNLKITAAEKSNVAEILNRLTKHTIEAAQLDGMDVQINPPVTVSINSKNSSENFNNQYGILPFAMSASKDELLAVIKQLEQAKYMLTERGDNQGAWRAKHRQNLLMSVLSGITSFSLIKG